nr:MAG: hypothetical protein DIU57_12025 [Pseudomonadota bacterium]
MPARVGASNLGASVRSDRLRTARNLYGSNPNTKIDVVTSTAWRVTARLRGSWPHERYTPEL